MSVILPQLKVYGKRMTLNVNSKMKTEKTPNQEI